MIVIWQCPSVTGFGDELLHFNSISVHPVFQRTSRLRTRKSIGLWSISVSILWEQAPQKLLTKFFQILEKILCPKKSKNIFPILGQKTMQIDVIWSQGYVKIVFLTKNQFYNFLIFGLRKISKIFEKFVKFFSNFFSNFSIFYTFFVNFYNLSQLLTHLELYWTLQNMSSIIGWGDKRFQKSTKIQLFWTNFLGKLIFESFLDLVTLTIINVFLDARHSVPW